MKRICATAFLAVSTTALVFCFASLALAGNTPPIISGQNGTDPGVHIDVFFNAIELGSDDGHWTIGDPDPIPLIAEPKAPPMEKWFHTPVDSSGQPLPLEPGWSAPVWENFFVWPGDPNFPDVSPAITDWHEHIHEPGWEWIVPSPGSTNPSLITRNHEAWPWDFIPPPAGTDPDPAWLWVKFDPIEPGFIFDIHKELVWRGTTENSVWGDNKLDDGTPFDERMIGVWEYPTIIPEPSACALFGLGLLCLGYGRRNRR